MFKKLHNFFFALLSFFIISCNFTFNDSKSTSLTVNCSKKSSREITYDEFEDGKLSIYILGDKTNHYQHLEGTVYNDYFFDDLPEDLYLIHADFYVNSILRATAEDFVIIKALKNESVTLHMEEVETRFDTNKVYPGVIEDWDSLKSKIETETEYETYLINTDMQITDKITINRKINIVATSEVNLSFSDYAGTILSVTNAENAQLVIETLNNNDAIYINGSNKEFENSLFVTDKTLEMSNVVVYDVNTSGNGGVITSRGKVILTDCQFDSITATGNGGVVYGERGSLTIKGYYESGHISTKMIGLTSFDEDFYLIADGDAEYTFEDANCSNVVMYVQNNNKPTITVTEGCTGSKNTLSFGASTDEFSATEIEPWKTLFSVISNPNGTMID